MRRDLIMVTALSTLVMPVGPAVSRQAEMTPGEIGQAPTRNQTAPRPDQAMNDQDRRFADDAARGGQAEVKLGQMAASRAQSQAVKDFGNRMVLDHGRGNDILQRVATMLKLSLPTDLKPQVQVFAEQLSVKSGREFDRAYIDQMVKDHQADLAAFEIEARKGSNQQLRTFAANQLSTLHQHLELARKIQAGLR